jgi:hypothetical protein
LTSRFADPFASVNMKPEILEHIMGLSADSPGWGEPVDGLIPIITYAHVAAKRGLLPEGFDQWDLKTSTGESVAHYAVLETCFPNDFKHWALKNDHGFSVAHFAVNAKTLPKDFEHWDITNDTGVSIAHMAAATGDLPPDVPIRVWALRDKNGWTAAHVAADSGHLPPDVPDEVLRLRQVADDSPDSSVAATVLVADEKKTVQAHPRVVERAKAIHEEMLGEQAAGEAESGGGPESDVPGTVAPRKDSSASRKSKRTSSSARRRGKKV